MCGIVGYTGPRDAGPLLMDGLRRLEYRGYDSAGIALITEAGDLFVEKKAGKLSNLRTALGDATPRAGIGLGHTRWATHGRPNDLNAHPHSDCTGDVTVIHNGIIENFRELRDGLTARGHVLRSETDTEAIAHLIEESYDGDIAEAVRRALRQLQGTYALVVLHRREPDRLIGARRDNPLIAGIGDGESFLASDASAVIASTNRVIFLADGDVADLRPGSVTVSDVAGHPIDRPIEEIPWTPEAAEKGGYAHFMLKEIYEQPGAVRAALAGRLHGDEVRLPEIDAIAERLAGIERVELIACGTASYAALVGARLFEQWARIPARVTAGSEFRYSPPPLDDRTLIVAVTQSGETLDTIVPTRYAREQGCPVVAITNTVGSAITRDADASLFLQAGPEIGVAATKTFVTQITTLVLLAARLARGWGRLDAPTEAALVAELRQLPDKVQRALDLSSDVAGLARQYLDVTGFMFIGRGATYPAVLEGALKLKEISYVHAEGYAAGELKHGPIALLERRVPLVAVTTRSSTYDKIVGNVMEGRARDARIIAVATEGDERVDQLADDVCYVPDTLEELGPVLAVIPLQLFAYHTAVARGTDVDQPRNLAKSVTVE